MRSRRSMKTSPPWSRRRCTQPATRTSEPTRSAQHLPAPGVAVSFAPQRRELGGRLTVAAVSQLRRRELARRPRPRSTSRCSPRAHVAQLRRAVGRRGSRVARRPTRSACFIWPLMLRPARSRSAREARAPQLGDEREARGRAAVGGDDEDVDAAAGAGRRSPSASSDPLDPGGPAARRASAGRRAARSGRRSGRRRRPPTGRRAGRSRTRRRSACSSRGRGPGSRRAS